jgi:two-component system chemotaxis response regulator CheY
VNILVVDDDFSSRLLLQELLKPYGTVHVAVNGKEAIDAICAASQQNRPYRLICLDIMMPELDGQSTLRQIRQLEEQAQIDLTERAKVIMTTALSDVRTAMTAYTNLCNAYLIKPIDKAKLLDVMAKLGLETEVVRGGE